MSVTHKIVYQFANRRRRPPRYRRARRHGCLPAWVILAVLVGSAWGSWTWISERLIPATQAPPRDLSDATRAFAEGDLDQTVALARAIYTAEPKRTDALLLLVRALIYRSYRDYDRAVDRLAAVQLANVAVNRRPADPDALTARALALHANDDSLEAFRMAERALIMDPQHALARAALALSASGLGVFDRALSVSEQALADAPSVWRYDVLRARAVILSDVGRYDEALTVSGQASALNNRLAVTHFERALYALQLGDFNTATTEYFTVLSHDSENVKARLRLCELSTVLRENDNAERYCREVTQRAPAWADGWYRLGRASFLRGDFESAQQALNRCTVLQNAQGVAPDARHFECWYLQGQSAERLGDCESLRRIYDDAQTWIGRANPPLSWVYPPEGPCAVSPP